MNLKEIRDDVRSLNVVGKRIEDLTGRRFGRLIVIKFHERIKNRGTFWLCMCDCGNEKIIRATNLKSGDTKSCGCWAREHNAKPAGEASFIKLYLHYRGQAQMRGLLWKLTKEEAKRLFTSSCFYCGAAPSQVIYRKRANGSFTYNGIDRVDNKQGYSIENCVACCGQCNRAKTDMSINEFKNWVDNVYHQFVKTAELGRVR